MDREQALADAGCPACGAPLKLVAADDASWPGSCAACGVRLYYLRPGQNPPPAFRTWDDARHWLIERRRTAHEWRLLRAVANPQVATARPARAVVRCRRAALHDPPGWHVCETCRTADGRIYDVADALGEMPLPHRECTCHWPDGMEGVCACEWVFEGEADAVLREV